MKFDFVIGIDPDIDKSGFACISTKNDEHSFLSLAFPELIAMLQLQDKYQSSNRVVVVEASWKSKANWHINSKDSRQTSAIKHYHVGRNHQTGILIAEMCRYTNLEVIEHAPLKKMWSGPDGKITHAEICQFIPNFPTRSNQEVRDAALLAWNYIGYPIRIRLKR